MAKAFVVRYGSMLDISTFSARSLQLELKVGDRIIVKSDRGTELGVVVYPAREEIETENLPKTLRKATPEDEKRWQKVEEEEKPAEYKFCQQRIKELKLPMKLIDVEHIFGRERIIFYFLADGRVDFRQLVKDLAGEYKPRIELKQIGVRDEARLLADYEHCGREICCRAFMKELEPVTMKMAKNQKATLDPAKISGRCGRLMCCLRFEDKIYEQLKKNLPPKGTFVTTSSGLEGEVVDYDILKQEATVESDGSRRVVVKVSEIVSREGKREPRVSRPEEEDESE